MTSPEEIEKRFTLMTATARYEELRVRDALAPAPGEAPRPASLGPEEALELLALGEVTARKAAYGRQLAVRSARRAGASWSQIGGALGTSKQAAWEAHTRWVDGQAAAYGKPGQMGFDDADVAEARAIAG